MEFRLGGETATCRYTDPAAVDYDNKQRTPRVQVVAEPDGRVFCIALTEGSDRLDDPCQSVSKTACLSFRILGQCPRNLGDLIPSYLRERQS